MERLTSPENQIKNILEGLGYVVRGWSQHSIIDPPNIVYMQMPIARKGGRKPFRADFAFPYAQIDLEVDGEYWHRWAAVEGKVRDGQRDRELREMGWKVVRLPSHLASCVAAQHLRQGLWQLMDLA